MTTTDQTYATLCHENSSIGNTDWFGMTVGDEIACSDIVVDGLHDGDSTYYLVCDHFGFAIPTDARIDGILIYNYYIQNWGGLDSYSVRAVKNGTIQSTELTPGGWSVSDNAYELLGGETDLLGTTWTPTNINNDNFGIAISVICTDEDPSNGSTASIILSAVTVFVYYTEGAGGGGGGGGGGGLYANNVFCMFRSVPIPKKVAVNKAFVRFTAKDSSGAGIHDGNGNDIVKAMVSGQAADTGTYPIDADDAYSIVKTTSCTAWDDVSHWTADTTYDTPDIACVIQEIVDRSGWASGNDITLFVQDYDSGNTGSIGVDQTRLSYDYNDDSSKAPQLFVYYSLEEIGSGGVVAGGSAITNKISIRTTSGGAVIGGNCGVNTLYSKTASGGAIVGGLVLEASISSFSEIGSGGVVAGGARIIKTIYSKTTSGGVVVAGLAYIPGGGGGPSVPVCTAIGTGTPVGKLIQVSITSDDDDGYWTYTYAFDSDVIKFGSITPIV